MWHLLVPTAFAIGSTEAMEYVFGTTVLAGFIAGSFAMYRHTRVVPVMSLLCCDVMVCMRVCVFCVYCVGGGAMCGVGYDGGAGWMVHLPPCQARSCLVW